MHPALLDTGHRKEPLPARPWALTMEWHELALLHWPVDPDQVQRLLPDGLQIETRDGAAWLGVVPFVMRNVRPRWLPPAPGAANFPELNLRTYVTYRGVPGVWFFSLDAGSKLAVRGARLGFGLPYFDARMQCERSSTQIRYASERTHRGAPPATLQASWELPQTYAAPAAGTLAHWFVERYRMYVVLRGRIRVGHIAHAPWQLAETKVALTTCDMARLCGIELRGAPAHTHAAAPLTVAGWLPSQD